MKARPFTPTAMKGKSPRSRAKAKEVAEPQAYQTGGRGRWMGRGVTVMGGNGQRPSSPATSGPLQSFSSTSRACSTAVAEEARSRPKGANS